MKLLEKIEKNKAAWTSFLLTLVMLTAYSCSTNQSDLSKVDWPSITQDTKPWTRWWWHGSAVNKKDLTANLEELKNAGYGGVEITPIYGVKGYEHEDKNFLSSEWMELFSYTLKEGKRLDLGIDLANASGWPFGGPWISADDACKNVQYKIYTLAEGEKLTEKIKFIQKPLVRAVGHSVDISEIKYPIASNNNLQELTLDQVRFERELPLQVLMAYKNGGITIDLTDKVNDDGYLDWIAPTGQWEIIAVFQGWHGKMVERAGRGGEGNVIDHFSETATKKFLDVFDNNAKDIKVEGLRAFFNDSYEVDDASGEANWTPLFFEEFNKLRGYDLKNYLPALFGKDSEEMNRRVICDYRETISDLLLDRFTNVWGSWSKKYSAGIRNQAHGSPANILDLYAASDIPETEGVSPMRIKMATSAGHVSGKSIIACEAATWLDEHFLSDLSAVKQNLDRYFTHGVNHIVYHGTPYSPLNEKWPGWLFYASVHFAPTNTWWEDLKTINSYVTNYQSFLQSSTPANDILLYFPIYDKWSDIGNSMLQHFGTNNEELTKALSEELLNKGYTFDYISDKQIKNLDVKEGKIFSKGVEYKTIIIPNCEFIPLETIEKVISLADKGANVVIENKFPTTVAGLYNLAEKQKAYTKLKDNIKFDKHEKYDVSKVNNGKILKTDKVLIALDEMKIFAEELADKGLWFNKVNRKEGACYFINNWSDEDIDQWLTINTAGGDAIWFNPMNNKFGKAKIKNINDFSSKVFVQLSKGESLILQWYSQEQNINDYPIYENGKSVLIDDNWSVNFIKGGPTIPKGYETNELKSWTEQSEELKWFSGTARYKTTFSIPNVSDSNYLLDLGEVFESAIVILNGEKLGTLIGPKFKIVVESGKLRETNELELLVTNLMANRIIYMEKKGEVYKNFYNINFSARYRENYISGIFTAKHWSPLKSGLIGPVTLTSLIAKEFE